MKVIEAVANTSLTAVSDSTVGAYSATATDKFLFNEGTGTLYKLVNKAGTTGYYNIVPITEGTIIVVGTNIYKGTCTKAWIKQNQSS